MASAKTDDAVREFDAHVLPDYSAELDLNRRYLVVSDGLCKVLDYSREELIGKQLDEITAPRTNTIPVTFELFLRNHYMHGVWIFVNHSRNVKLFMRYEAWLRSDSRVEWNMELIGAGA